MQSIVEKNVACHSSSTRIKPLATAVTQDSGTEGNSGSRQTDPQDNADPYLRNFNLQILASSHT